MMSLLVLACLSLSQALPATPESSPQRGQSDKAGLPDDVLTNLFTYLPVSDQNLARQADKHINLLVSDLQTKAYVSPTNSNNVQALTWALFEVFRSGSPLQQSLTNSQKFNAVELLTTKSKPNAAASQLVSIDQIKNVIFSTLDIWKRQKKEDVHLVLIERNILFLLQ